MNLLSLFNFDQDMFLEKNINELSDEELVLTSEDAKQIINVRNKLLKNYGRVELNFDVTKKLIRAFSSSAFIDENNYVRILNDIQESFYYVKNETEDRLGDDRLIQLMKYLFENSCEGSVELMNSRLEEFAKHFRLGGDGEYELFRHD